MIGYPGELAGRKNTNRVAHTQSFWDDSGKKRSEFQHNVGRTTPFEDENDDEDEYVKEATATDPSDSES